MAYPMFVVAKFLRVQKILVAVDHLGDCQFSPSTIDIASTKKNFRHVAYYSKIGISVNSYS